MLDIGFIRDNSELVKKIARQKNVDVDVDELLRVDKKRRDLQTQIDMSARQKNLHAKKNMAGKPSPDDIAEGKRLKSEITKLQKQLDEVKDRYTALLQSVPNIPSEDTPIGVDHTGNVVKRRIGNQPKFSFSPKPHWELGDAIDVIDSKRAADITGTRFAYLKGALVQLQFAIIQYAMSVMTDQTKIKEIIKQANLSVTPTPFIPVLPPVMVRPKILQQMARLEPKEERYYIESDNVYLVGSAEHTLGPLHRDETFKEAALPRRYLGYSTNFRREAGSHGKDVRGILRVHQFDKLEMESFTTSDNSQAEQDLFVAIQEHMMQALGLAYQVVQVCTGDMGAPDARQIDIETWLPGQNAYRETHTADFMTDYQARRLHTKVKRQSGTLEYVHMNDATAFALGRILIAIMENYQQANGSISVPKVLRPYLSFSSFP